MLPWFCLWLIGLLPAGPAYAADELQTVTVATRAVPPFAYRGESGEWQGIAIELWERVAAELKLRSEYREVSLRGMLGAVETGTMDVAVGALSVTPEREITFDFTHPFYHTGLGIAVPVEESSGWLPVLRSLTSPQFLGVVGSLLTLLAIVGAVVWVLERRRNPQFPSDPVKGIGAGLWWSSVTMTTVGYGDKAPTSFGGRFVALIWMFVSVVLISTITASLTTSLTLGALSGKVSSEADLANVRTATVVGSTSERRMQRNGVHAKAYDDLGAALSALDAGDVDAVVYDKPLLLYRVRTGYAGKLYVLELDFEPQDYAIALPTGSRWREPVNRLLLEFTRGDAWEQLLRRHLGG